MHEIEPQSFPMITHRTKIKPSERIPAKIQERPEMAREKTKRGRLPQTSMMSKTMRQAGTSTRAIMIKLRLVLLVSSILSALNVNA